MTEIEHRHKDTQGKNLISVTLINLSISVVQVIGGLISGSLSLLSDALHNFGDTSALFIAYLARRRGRKRANLQKTFGYKRIEILAALYNASILIALCLFLFYSAYKRLLNPETVDSKLMLIVAVFGLLANLVSVLIIQKGRHENLNVKAAYLHLLGDTLSSFAVIAGGILMWAFEVYWVDPLITILVGFYIIYHSWKVIRETLDILMQSSPDGIDLSKLKERIETIDAIDNIHHVHVWRLTDAQVHFEAHINLKENLSMDAMMKIKEQTEQILQNDYKIDHMTLQFGYGCCNGNKNIIFSDEQANQ
jgi:cobalt-zinc-cadmium efflux system protein